MRDLELFPEKRDHIGLEIARFPASGIAGEYLECVAAAFSRPVNCTVQTARDDT